MNVGVGQIDHGRCVILPRHAKLGRQSVAVGNGVVVGSGKMPLLRRRFPVIIAGLAISLTVFAGCKDSRPSRVQVHGRVIYNGKPATTGTICFLRVADKGGTNLNRPATAELASDGSYTMRTFGKDDGVLPGEYVVTITAVDYSRAVNISRSEGPPMSPKEVQSQLLLPVKYSSPEKSGLKASVPPDASGPLQIDFDLED